VAWARLFAFGFDLGADDELFVVGIFVEFAHLLPVDKVDKEDADPRREVLSIWQPVRPIKKRPSEFKKHA
jgi:hypothetical protein